jgi:hypothetical protein
VAVYLGLAFAGDCGGFGCELRRAAFTNTATGRNTIRSFGATCATTRIITKRIEHALKPLHLDRMQRLPNLFAALAMRASRARFQASAAAATASSCAV